MKIEKFNITPRLYEFVSQNVPDGMAVRKDTDGWCLLCGIKIVRARGFFHHPCIAYVVDAKDVDEIHVYDKRHIDDFALIAALYEEVYGVEVTIRVHDQPRRWWICCSP